jgi:hypothetical protein
MSMRRNPNALIAVLDIIKPLLHRITATTSVRRARFRSALPLRVRHVRRTRTHPKAAGLRPTVGATQATAGLMAARAPLVWQASTRRRREMPRVQIVKPESIPQQWRQPRMYVPTVRQARYQQQMVRVYARTATTEIFKMSQDKPHARGAGPESLQAMTTMPEPLARIASLVSSKRTKAQPHASHAILESIRRPLDKPCAHSVLPVCSLPLPVQRTETSV